MANFYAGHKRIEGKNIRQRFPQHIKYGDIIKGLPLKEGSCDGIYSSHVLEHLSLADFRSALVNTHKLLKPGGTFRVVVPDVKALVREYMESSSPAAAVDFIRATGMGTESRTTGVRALLKSLLANHGHLWLWDYESVELELGKAGFVDIRSAAFNDSSDVMFREVEDASRFSNSVAIECSRPQNSNSSAFSTAPTLVEKSGSARSIKLLQTVGFVASVASRRTDSIHIQAGCIFNRKCFPLLFWMVLMLSID